MDVCVVLLYKDSSMKHKWQKDLKVQNGSKEKKKSRRGHKWKKVIYLIRYFSILMDFLIWEK
jgi:hypothetical protein